MTIPAARAQARSRGTDVSDVQVLDRPPSGPLIRHALVTAAAAVAVVGVILAPVAVGRVVDWIQPVRAVPAGR